ncbi:hypothetical protein [Streptomyces chryseus]
MANQPVREDRPRWGLWLADSGDGNGYTLAYRVHHAAQDGSAMVHTLQQLLPPGSATAPVRADPAGEWSLEPPHTTHRLLAEASVPLEVMRTAARRADATVHDVYLAALAAALRYWLPPDRCQRPVRVRVPFSTLLPADRPDLGNRVGNMLVALPVDEPDAWRQLKLLGSQNRAWKASGARERTRRILDRLQETLVIEQMSADEPDDVLGCASSFRFRVPMAVAGDRVTAVTALPAHFGGHLFSSALCTYGNWASTTFTARTNQPRVRELPALWERAVRYLSGDTNRTASRQSFPAPSP